MKKHTIIDKATKAIIGTVELNKEQLRKIEKDFIVK